jgi:hypothetical protein
VFEKKFKSQTVPQTRTDFLESNYDAEGKEEMERFIKKAPSKDH